MLISALHNYLQGKYHLFYKYLQGKYDIFYNYLQGKYDIFYNYLKGKYNIFYNYLQGKYNIFYNMYILAPTPLHTVIQSIDPKTDPLLFYKKQGFFSSNDEYIIIKPTYNICFFETSNKNLNVCNFTLL